MDNRPDESVGADQGGHVEVALPLLLLGGDEAYQPVEELRRDLADGTMGSSRHQTISKWMKDIYCVATDLCEERGQQLQQGGPEVGEAEAGC